MERKMLVVTYLLYLCISITITYGVARTLSRNGRVFLVDGFGGKEDLADSINHLLVVGFYLINIGYIGMSLRFMDQPQDVAQMIMSLSTRIGVIMIILGGMHLFNMFVISRLRQRALNFRREAKKEEAGAAGIVVPTPPWQQAPTIA
jgi:hypothetical protein